MLTFLAMPATLPGATPASVQTASIPPLSNEVRGVWMWSSSVRQDGAEKVAADLSQHNINRVFLLVKGYSGAVCYKSKLAPEMVPGKDSLKELIDACHKRGIEVHAWFVFNADNVWGNSHPDDVMYHAGNPDAWVKGPYSKKNDREKLPICPLSKGYQKYFKKLVKEVVDNYSVDGIHLDYIRYGHMCYCFCPRHQAVAASHGIQIDKVRQAIYDTFYASPKKSDHYFQLYREGDKDITGWVRLRQEEIDRAVKDIRAIVKHKNPALVLSASFMPEGGEADDTFAICHYAQNYATAGAQLDYILPMTYYKGPEWAAKVALNAEKKSHRPAYSGLWASDEPGEAPAGGGDSSLAANKPAGRAVGLRNAVYVLRERGVKGFVLFRYGTMTDSMWKELP